MTALGLPGWELLKSPDPVERIAATAVAERLIEMKEEEADGAD